MSTSKAATETRRRIIRLSSPRGEEETNLLQWQFGMKWALKARKLWYLIDGTVKMENGVPVIATARQDDADMLISFILENIHEDNIGLIMNITDPKLMWQELESSHLLNSSGSRYYYLRILMAMPTPDKEGIRDHLMQIENIGTSLNKICVDGKISIKDIKVAALTASLPSIFHSVVSHKKQQTAV